MFKGIHMPRLPSGHSYHEYTSSCRVLRRIHDEVHVVGHHTGGLDTTSQRLFPFPQIIEVGLVIRVVRKDHVAIVPPVHAMMREVRQNDSGGVGHGSEGEQN